MMRINIKLIWLTVGCLLLPGNSSCDMNINGEVIITVIE